MADPNIAVAASEAEERAFMEAAVEFLVDLSNRHADFNRVKQITLVANSFGTFLAAAATDLSDADYQVMSALEVARSKYEHTAHLMRKAAH